MRTLDVCLAMRICGDNGIPRDSLDVCFGDQLAGFVTLGNLCIGVGTRFRLNSSVETLGYSLKYFCVG